MPAWWSGSNVAERAAPDDEAVETVRRSELVDADWYRERYPDVAAAGLDPVTHYVVEGAAEGRDPNALFDTDWYLARNPDVRDLGLNPLLHFVETGAEEGRDPHPDFDIVFYLNENPEVALAKINPLRHFLTFGRPEGRRAKPHDEAEALESAIRAARVTGMPLRGPQTDQFHFPLRPGGGQREANGLALPSEVLARRIGSPTLDNYAEIGRGTRDTIVRALPAGFSFAGARCLDFGCGVARVLRYFADEAKQAEFWGCDIDGPSIRWSVENLSPPFRFFQIGEVPSIPFEDDSFDLVYAISVFSHIHVDWHHWLMEVRRILKPGGTFFVTFMGQTPFEEMLGRSYWDHAPDFGMLVKNPLKSWNSDGPMVFVSPGWIKAYWGSLFDIDLIAMDGLLDYQSFCILRKPKPGAPIGNAAPLVELGTTQAFDADAVGRIAATPDLALPFRDSYGIEARGPMVVNGWIAFRGDSPVSLDLLVDGAPVPARPVFEAGDPYRDWADTRQTAFSAEIDCSGLPAGPHRLEARLTSARGRKHTLSIPLIVRA